MKKLLSVILAALTLLGAQINVTAAGEISVSELSQCKKVSAYSGREHAYFYGHTNSSLYSSQVIPNTVTRRADVNGVIFYSCHDENNAFALYRGYDKRWYVLKMDMHTGECMSSMLPEREKEPAGFAACGNSVYVIVISGAYFAADRCGLGGGYERTFQIPSGAKKLFVNDSRAYALSNENCIYELAGGGAVFAAQTDGSAELGNAGVGCVRIGERHILHLTDGRTQTTEASFAVNTIQGLAEADGCMLFAAAKGQKAALDGSYNCVIESMNEDKRQPDSSENGGGHGLSAANDAKDPEEKYTVKMLLAVLDRLNGANGGYDVNGDGAVNMIDAALIADGLNI